MPPRHIHLDGFTYDGFFGGSPISAAVRKQWLLCQRSSHLGESFRTQPFEQLIRVLRDMGLLKPAASTLKLLRYAGKWMPKRKPHVSVR